MSQATKKKHVAKEVLDEFCLPEGEQRIVQILAGKGNNLHQVLDPKETKDDGGDDGQKYLVSMPTKFRKNVWIKRGDYVIVEPIAEGDKVRAEIVRILYKEQIKHIKKENLWPDFPGEGSSAAKKEDGEEGEEEDIFVNTNRPSLDYPPSSSESETDEEEDD